MLPAQPAMAKSDASDGRAGRVRRDRQVRDCNHRELPDLRVLDYIRPDCSRQDSEVHRDHASKAALDAPDRYK
jgi:hypothetical protein